MSSRPFSPAQPLCLIRCWLLAQVNVTLSGLEALQPYTIYCYAESADALPLTQTAGPQSVRLTTPCCHTLGRPSLPTYLRQRVASPVLSLDRRNTSLEITVTIALARYNGSTAISATTDCSSSSFSKQYRTNSSLGISPSSAFDFSDGGRTDTFVLYPNAPGCYRLRYTITGRHASLFAKAADSFLLVLGPASTLPAPKLLSARLSVDASQVRAHQERTLRTMHIQACREAHPSIVKPI